MSDENKSHRKIRSFARRTGRMTLGQKLGMEEGWPHFGLNFDQGMIDPAIVFEREGPLVIEVGFGMGTSLLDMAENEPDKNFIGIEVHTPGVGSLLNGVVKNALTNIRVYEHDAVEILADCIPDACVDRFQLYFPDPWHKKKHHKRRIVKPEFIQEIRRILKVDGVFHLATDWEHYAEHMLEEMEAAEGFDNAAGKGSYSPKPEYRPSTKFERRGERLGHGVWDLLYQRKN